MENSVVKTEENIKDLLSKHDFKHLEDFKELNSYFDIDSLCKDCSPKITTDHKILIVIDNEKFNETYLIDVVNIFLDENTSIAKNVELVYIDNIDIKHKLFKPSIPFEKSKYKNKFDFEKTNLTPGIMCINPFEEDITFWPEILPFEVKNIEVIINKTKLNE